MSTKIQGNIITLPIFQQRQPYFSCWFRIFCRIFRHKSSLMVS